MKQTTTAAVFSRGDSNLLNWLRDGHSSPVVDFEYSGHSTVHFDAADLIEHISAREIPDSTWSALLPDLGITPANRHLFLAAQRTCALRWLAVLWKQRHTRADEFAAQRTRVRRLQSPDKSLARLSPRPDGRQPRRIHRPTYSASRWMRPPAPTT
ncbi:hypothetical protein JCM4814A_02120 [Streptomyces phaeofaciens JCM 4814]|uniref:Uncharacterized protein n=1 Tax=Streptomyces phaeofaciens TaxID=68254 RepID=A0A918HQJ7_9ACTN|nr:hypothetical protein GCM10010226_84110 [Streptomyces phaeofaciens]